MKKDRNAAFVLRLALTLLIITSAVAAILAFVNSVTAPRIEMAKEARIQAAIETVLPGGGTPVEDFADESGLVSRVYRGDNGYAVEVNPAGFNGPITMMVGVDHSGRVLAVSVVTQTETAGLGAVSAADTSAGEAFRGQFTGLTGELTVTKDGGTVDALTGATITSRAVTAGVSAALACVAAMG